MSELLCSVQTNCSTYLKKKTKKTCIYRYCIIIFFSISKYKSWKFAMSRREKKMKKIAVTAKFNHMLFPTSK